ncbi:MAG: DinB family protein [Acidobacteriota bacterium]
MIGPPERSETARYYDRYIDRVQEPDVLAALESQLERTSKFLSGISAEDSAHRYAPGKWSIRQVWSHVNDTERLFVFRAFWFARGFDSPLPGFDQDVSAAAHDADAVAWERHLEEFRAVRTATLSFFRNLAPEAWMRRGIASDSPFSVRALAWITAGHVEHHIAVLREKYLPDRPVPDGS